MRIGDIEKSGGVATNIGVHFFDMLSHVFGEVKDNIVHYSDKKKAAGYLEFKKARVSKVVFKHRREVLRGER